MESISIFDPLTGEVIRRISRTTIYPKSHYVTPRETVLKAVEMIKEELAERLGLGREAFLPSPCDLEVRGCTSSITELVDGSPNPLAASESFELSVPRLGMPCKDEEAAESGSSMMPVGGRSITDALEKLRAPATIADGGFADGSLPWYTDPWYPRLRPVS